MRIPSVLLLALAGSAAAQAPGDFAWQWPLGTEGEQGAYRLVLDEEVYSHLSRPDLRDLAVFNADGQPVPFAPLPVASRTREQREELRWLRLPLAADGATDDSFSLSLQRDEDGRLRQLQLDAGTVAAPAPSTDVLVDRGEDPDAVSSLRVSLGDNGGQPVNLRVQVLASDDLAGWRSLGHDLALVAIDDNGLRVERLRLDFEPSQARYLRLHLDAGQSWPLLAKLEQERRETDRRLPERQQIELEGVPVDGEPGVFAYRSPGPLPVDRVDVKLPLANTVATALVESRDDDGTHWLAVSTFTAFRLGSGDEEVRHLPADTALERDRQWRVRTVPPLAQAPTLVLSYRPDAFVLLAQGASPYRLYAGSARATRPDYPVQAALVAAGANRPEGWVPPDATLGEGAEAAGGAALVPERGPEHRRWALWAVLLAGAALVVFVAVRVLRTPPPAH